MKTKEEKTKHAKLFYKDLFGVRQTKYDFLWNHDIDNTKWKKINYFDENNFFSYKNFIQKSNYDNALKLQDIFNKNKMGVITKRDNFVIDFNKDYLQNRINIFLNKNISDYEITERYRIQSTYEWNMNDARKKLFSAGLLKNKLLNYHYRPFDLRYIYYEGSIIARDVKEIMINLFKPNIALNCMRQFYGSAFNHIFTSNFVSDIN